MTQNLLLILHLPKIQPRLYRNQTIAQAVGRGRGRSLSGGGANIHIFMFTYLENNGFQKKLIRQNMNI